MEGRRAKVVAFATRAHAERACPKMPIKTVHFVRHGESEANVQNDWNIFDPRLTRTGIAQATSLQSVTPTLGVEAVFVSPLTRALQTASFGFAPILQLHQASSSSSSSSSSPSSSSSTTISSSSSSSSCSSSSCGSALIVDEEKGQMALENAQQKPKVPMIVTEDIRETIGWLQCDKRRPVATLHGEFPHADFSCVPTDPDTLWTEDRETEDEYDERVARFTYWLFNQPFECVACVSHMDFLRHLLTSFDIGPHELDDDDELRMLSATTRHYAEMRDCLSRDFENAELRTLYLVRVA